MPHTTDIKNAQPSRAEIIASRRALKLRALAGDSAALLALSNCRLADVIEERAETLVENCQAVFDRPRGHDVASGLARSSRLNGVLRERIERG